MSNNNTFRSGLGSSQPIRASHHISTSSTGSQPPPPPADPLDSILKQGYDGEEADMLNPTPTVDMEEYEFIEAPPPSAQIQPSTPTTNTSAASNYASATTTTTTSLDATEFDSFINTIDAHFDSYELLQRYSQKLGIKGRYIVTGGAVVLLLTTAKLAGFVALVHTCVWLYGSYTTYKALAEVARNNDTASHDSSTSSSSSNNNHSTSLNALNNTLTQPVLCFWCVYMLFRLVEYAADTVVYTLTYRSLMYSLGKIALLCYMMLPPFNAYTTVYTKYVSPLYDKYEDRIHEHSHNALNVISGLAIEVQAVLFQALGAYMRSADRQHGGTAQSTGT